MIPNHFSIDNIKPTSVDFSLTYYNNVYLLHKVLPQYNDSGFIAIRYFFKQNFIAVLIDL